MMSTGRGVLGICGAPGAGKSTLAERLVAARIGEDAVVVPMDGFHLHDDELARLALSERKGAPETFDVAGYVALLGRLRTESERHRLRPGVRPQSRSWRSPARSPSGRTHRLVVTEGNYLLHDEPGWADVRPLLDEVWFVEGRRTGTRVQRPGGAARAHGKPLELARRWTLSSDQANADLVARTRGSADVVVRAD